jgi:hypothetical protein
VPWHHRNVSDPEAHMTLHPLEETHRQLVERIPAATGRTCRMVHDLEDGPALSRFDERVNWLRSEYD